MRLKKKQFFQLHFVVFGCSNRADPEGMSLEELEITEMTTEALNAIMQRPSTRKYRSHVIKHTANFLEKFGRVLEAERTNPDPNKVE